MELQYFEKFEYTCKTYFGYTNVKFVDELNKMGNDGWELIINTKDDVGRTVCIFKRKIVCKQIQSTK